MTTIALAVRLDPGAAGVELELAARQFCTVRQQVDSGAASEELLRAARAHLERAALALAEAYGWQPPLPV
jgi:hypothetical protein